MSEWISVKDRLPELEDELDFEWVVGCVGQGVPCVVQFSLEGGSPYWLWDIPEWNELKTEPTYWMPIPYPPAHGAS